MKLLLLLPSALFASACTCEQTHIALHHPAHTRVIASFQADKAPAKPGPATPASPAKKPTPKDLEPRPAPPGHLFM